KAATVPTDSLMALLCTVRRIDRTSQRPLRHCRFDEVNDGRRVQADERQLKIAGLGLGVVSTTTSCQRGADVSVERAAVGPPEPAGYSRIGMSFAAHARSTGSTMRQCSSVSSARMLSVVLRAAISTSRLA